MSVFDKKRVYCIIYCNCSITAVLIGNIVLHSSNIVLHPKSDVFSADVTTTPHPFTAFPLNYDHDVMSNSYQ